MKERHPPTMHVSVETILNMIFGGLDAKAQVVAKSST